MQVFDAWKTGGVSVGVRGRALGMFPLCLFNTTYLSIVVYPRH